MTVMTHVQPAQTVPQPRARGLLRLALRQARGAARIDRLHQAGSLKVLFPREAGPALEAVLLNTAGGLTGGDRMEVEIAAGAGARAVISTQAAERAYRAPPGPAAEVEVRLRAEPGARLDWLPQETILFEGAKLDRRLKAELDSGATALIVEPVIFGRMAMGEVLRDAHLHDRWQIRVGGRLVLADALRLAGDVQAQLARAAVAGGAGAMATLCLVGPGAAAKLGPVRALGAAASLIRDEVLFLRMLAVDGQALRRALIPVIECLTEASLPKVWRL
ncbi:urease accessory protein UreD [Limimaricola sp.]|uniref:urease accessory protein UreD n=1 Tax=Limimaricola sp. TaxID=2211665 RepID=UPI0025BB5448|nr:urease accessory protein UreD [Limimaricola sp.]